MSKSKKKAAEELGFEEKAEVKKGPELYHDRTGHKAAVLGDYNSSSSIWKKPLTKKQKRILGKKCFDLTILLSDDTMENHESMASYQEGQKVGEFLPGSASLSFTNPSSFSSRSPYFSSSSLSSNSNFYSGDSGVANRTGTKSTSRRASSFYNKPSGNTLALWQLNQQLKDELRTTDPAGDKDALLEEAADFIKKPKLCEPWRLIGVPIITTIGKQKFTDSIGWKKK